MGFLVGREWGFYMSQNKHLSAGERIAKIAHARAVFFRLAYVVQKLGVIDWEESFAAGGSVARRYEEIL